MFFRAGVDDGALTKRHTCAQVQMTVHELQRVVLSPHLTASPHLDVPHEERMGTNSVNILSGRVCLLTFQRLIEHRDRETAGASYRRAKGQIKKKPRRYPARSRKNRGDTRKGREQLSKTGNLEKRALEMGYLYKAVRNCFLICDDFAQLSSDVRNRMHAILRKFGAQFATNLRNAPLANAPFSEFLRKEPQQLFFGCFGLCSAVYGCLVSARLFSAVLFRHFPRDPTCTLFVCCLGCHPDLAFGLPGTENNF